MRYWVYKDAQIRGPLAREDLASGLRPDTLVCEEGASAGRETEWRCAEDVPELSGLYLSGSPAAPGCDPPDFEFSLLERLQLDMVGMDSAMSEGDWLSGMFGAAPLKGEVVAGSLANELLASQKRVRELTEELERLSRRQAEAKVSSPGPVPSPERASPPSPPVLVLPPEPPPSTPPLPEIVLLEEAPAAAPIERAPAAPVEPARVPAVGEEARAPEAAPIEQAAAIEPPCVPAAEAPFELGRGSDAEAPVEPAGVPDPRTAADSAGLEATLPSIEEPAAQDALEEPAGKRNTLKLAPIGKKGVKLGATKTFRSVRRNDPPAASAAPAAAPPPPAAAMAGETPLLPKLQPPPPLTARGPALAPPAAAPSDVLFSSESTQGPATKEVLARLAKPASVPMEAPKPKRGAPPFIIVSVLLMAGLSVGGWLFLRDNKGMKAAVNMGEDQAPLGAVEDKSLPPPLPPLSAPKLEAVPAVSAPPPAAAAQDERSAAIDLVKGYPLDGDRGTIGQWLQYSFTASPGFNEKWDAGAVESSTYLVQYTVQSSGKNMGQAITYLFEADVTRKTVKGKNPASRQLLAGVGQKQSKPLKRIPKRRRHRPAAPPEAVHSPQVPILPLPAESDLLPPSEDDASFRNDTVQPGL